MAWRPNERRIYRAFLLAYPAEFRHEYAPQMENLAEQRLESEPRLQVWMSLLADLMIHAPAEHLHILTRDVRHSLRLFWKSPGFTTTALFALALGVGASVTIFSLINAVLLRSLPFARPEQLLYIWTPLPRYQSLPRELSPSFADVLAWRSMSQSFESITALKQRTLTADAGNGPQRVGGTLVLGNFFETLQTQPILGRAILPADDRPGQERVAVISDRLWQSQWNRAPDAIGRMIRVGRSPYRVIGIMPPTFGYPHENDYPFAPAGLKHTDIWIPAALTPQQEADRLHSCDASIGRLRPGVTLARAQAEMSAIAARLDSLNVPEMRGSESLLVSFLDTSVGPVRPLMRLLAGAVFLVLLIACGNVASLSIARGLGRVHEMGVRTALGAPRARLIRQLITESLLLSSAGGLLGALFATGAVRAITRLNPGDIPRFDEASIDTRVLLFAVFVSVASGVVYGVLPAFAASRVNVSDLLRL